MPRPNSLTGATATLKIDGVDVKDYGMVVQSITDSMPDVRGAEEVIPLRHGSIDISTTYEAKTVSIQGDMIADSHSDLQANVDAIKHLLRVRQSGDQFPIELQDRTGYAYLGRLISFSITPKSLWFNGVHAQFSLTLRIPEPWVQKSTATTATNEVQVAKTVSITNAGNAPTPLSLEIRPKPSTNLLWGVSEAITGWTIVNGGMNTSTGIAATPLMYGTAMLRVIQTNPGNEFMAYQDITSIVNTAKYYVLSAYIRPIGTVSNSTYRVQVRCDIVGVVSGNVLGNAYTIGRSFIKFSGATYSGAGYIRAVVYADGANDEFYFDGVMLEEITAAQYADSSFEPGVYTDTSCGPQTYNCMGVVAKITGKNLCPAGAKDLDINNWIAGGGALGTIYDEEQGKPVLVSNGEPSNYRLASEHFRLDPGTYKLSFKYRVLSTGNLLVNILAIGENTAAKRSAGTWNATYFDGYLLNQSLSLADTWTSYSYGFTVPYGVSYVAIQFYDNGAATWDTLMLCDIQIESGSTATVFENYRAKQFILYPTYHPTAADKILIDGRHNQAMQTDDTTHSIHNLIKNFTGNFLELLPGANNLVLTTGRGLNSPPEYRGCAYTCVMKYRERRL